MTDKLYAEYGNSGHRFPRTTQEAFGPSACIFVSTECDEPVKESPSFAKHYAIVVYALAAIVIGVILFV